MATSGPSSWLGISPGRTPDIVHVDQRLISIVSAGASHLPTGYTVTISEGYNPGGHVSRSQHHISGRGAIDVQIWTPAGVPVPNSGADTTGLYRQLAQASYGEMLASHPELKGKLAWGGSFATVDGGVKPDLMHFDIGGERGTMAPMLSKLGPLPGVTYGAAGGGTAAQAAASMATSKPILSRAGVTPEAQSVYSLLVKGDTAHGVAPLSSAVAAGVVGNMMQEAYQNLRPDAKGAAGELGIGQWMPDRYANMVAWTTKNGLDPTSREGQALFYSHELQGSPAMAALAGVTTPADATKIIASKFERAGTPMMDRRINFANRVAGAYPATSNPDAALAYAATSDRAAPQTAVADASPAVDFAPPSIATQPPSLPANSVGADRVVRASLDSDPAKITSAWNDLIGHVISGGAAAKASAMDYFAKTADDVRNASAANFAFQPKLWDAVPALVRGSLKPAAEDQLTHHHAVDQMTQLGAWPPQGGDIPATVATTPPPTAAGGFVPDTPAVTDPGTPIKATQGEVPSSVTWPSSAAASGKDALQAIVDASPARPSTSPDTPAVADAGAVAQTTGGITPPPIIGPSPTAADVPDVSLGATPPAAAGAPPAAAPAPPKSMAASPPPSKGIAGRLYRAISPTIAPTSKSFWSGPMIGQSLFRSDGSIDPSGGSRYDYQPNTGRTTIDVNANRVNVGVYTDEHGNQHEYTWSPSGAP